MTSPSSTPEPPRPRLVGRVAFVVAVAVVALVGWIGWRHLADRQSTRRALQLAEHRPFGETEPLLREALKRDPDNLDVVKAIAVGLLGSERNDEAEAFLTQWCKLRPDDVQPFRLRMHVHHQSSQRG